MFDDTNGGEFPRSFYTLAADFIRSHGGYLYAPKLSRADAANIRSKIAEELGMPDEELAKVLARAYMRDNP